jgi:hypothetical protein
MFIGSTEEKKLQIWYGNACAAYKDSDGGRWEAARWCAKIVGKYERGATIGLASDMGVSPDTIENLAHAYLMFIELCSKRRYRYSTVRARNAPRVYYSHFRALYTARHRYNLSLAEVFDVLRDIVLDEGGISSRDIDGHISEKYGKVRDWMDYAESANKKIASLLKCPDLPDDGRQIFKTAFNWVGENVTGNE